LKSIYHLFQLPHQLLVKEIEAIGQKHGEQDQSLDLDLEYCKGLAFYLSGDIHELSNIINKIKSSTNFNDNNIKETVLTLLELRLYIRSKDCKNLQNSISKIELVDHSQIAENYLGEFYFILARSYELLNFYKQAAKNYNLAAQFYQNQGLNKKYLKSLFNATVLREYLNDTIKLDEYQAILKIAIRERDRSIIGCTLRNLSFQLLFSGSYNSAFKIINRSLKALRFESAGLNYQLAELNLAHLYYLMGYYIELAKIIRKLESSKYPEIIAGVKLLKTHNFSENCDDYSISWLWRLQKKISSMPKVSELEDKLMGYLILSSRSKLEIVTYLWPQIKDNEIRNDRFKKVLARIKTKRPNIISYCAPFYKLNINEVNKSIVLREDLNFNSETNHGEELVGDELKIKNILISRSQSFYELLESLYGNQESIEKLINRLKNLIGRVRKKCPSRLHYREGKYYWI